MSLFLIISFILIGLFLIWLEFFIVPGITIAGIGGIILILGGIFFAYSQKGNTVGHLVLVSSLVLLFVMFVISFRGKTWKKTALQTNIDGVVEGINTSKVHVGDTGHTISRLAPMGKIMVNDEIIEAKSKLGFIDQSVEVKILEIYSSNVLVERIKKETLD